jgi:hypothetical protein
MQRSLIIPILFFALQTSLFAQEKIDQYGQMPRDFEAGHLFHLSERLKNEPGTRCVIVINKSRIIDTGRFLRRVHGIREFIDGDIDRRRLDVYAGEERDRMLTRIWLVRPGEKPPVFGAFSLSDLLARKITKPTLFDSECLDCDNSPFIDQPLFPEGLDHYAAALKANPGSSARIIVGRTGLYTTARERRKLVSQILRRLVKKHRIKRNRITIRFINSNSAGLYIIPKKISTDR